MLKDENYEVLWYENTEKFIGALSKFLALTILWFLTEVFNYDLNYIIWLKGVDKISKDTILRRTYCKN